ncbi:MAG TPA: Cys-tRNA(Pro) deacylase [Tepidisphaeraceae bacterium]|nr:Cys-tRNA(Pro) deacylase [Tepidisphaeraceae bacterium]
MPIMTPAVQAAQRAKIAFTLHEYAHDAAAESFGLEAAAALHVDPLQIFKTLIAQTEDAGLAIGIVPVAARLNLKALATAVGAKKADLADPAIAQRATGYVVGGISPLGTRKRLPTVLDQSALSFPTIYVSAGRRGLQIQLSPQDLIRLTRATTAPIATA